MVGENVEVVGSGIRGGTSGSKLPTLEEYGTNLTKLAEEVKVTKLWISDVWFIQGHNEFDSLVILG